MAVNGSADNSTSTGVRTADSAPVRIDSDVQPVWETEAFPDWVINWLIPMLSAGQKWPDASESGLSKLACSYSDLGDCAVSSTPDAGAAAQTVVHGWAAPAAAEFVSRAKVLYGQEGGLAGVSANAKAYGQQTNTFAVETQYSKLSINIAFWVTVIAIAIGLVAAFFSAGASTAIIGPYAAAARAAISRILVRLATVGGRPLGAARLAQVTTLSGTTSKPFLARLFASARTREVVEEASEEGTIDRLAQRKQRELGTRKEDDWQKSAASLLGGGGGGLIGPSVAARVARVTGRVPGFMGRALTTASTNAIVSPVASAFTNLVVYRQWENPFTFDSVTGGFFGGLGRAGSVSMFNLDLYHQAGTSLASMYNTAAHAYARTAGDPPTGPAQGNPANGEPDPNGTPSSVRTTEPARTGAPAAQGGSARPAGAPDTGRPASAPTGDPATRRTSTTPDTGDRSQPDARPATRAAATPEPARDPGAQPERTRATSARTNEAAPDQNPDAPEHPASTTPEAQNQVTQEPAPQSPDPAPHNQSAPDPNPATPDQNTPDPNPGTPDQNTPHQNPGTPDQNATDPAAQSPGRPDQAQAQEPAAPAGQTPGTADQSTQADPRVTGEPAPAAGNPAVQAEGGPTTPQTSGDTTVTADGTAATVNPAQAPAPAPAPAPAAAPDQDTGTVAAGAHPARTVTSRPVPGTRYVTDGRQGPDLTLDEVRAAADEILAKHFLGRNVTGFTWSQDGTTLAVHTTTHGTQHFRPVVGRANRQMARTEVSRSATETDPHQIHFNPRVADDQLTRTWVEGITATLQELGSNDRGVFGRRRRAESRQAAARLNVLELLADQWRQAPTMPEKQRVAIDIEGVNQELRDLGHPAPPPPWAAQDVRPQHAPPVPRGRPSDKEVRALIDALRKAEEELQQQVQAKKDSAAKAREEALEATREARKTLRQHDSGRFERARSTRGDSRKHWATHRRHLRIAKAYEVARLRAVKSRETYEQLLSARQQPLRPNRRGQLSVPRAVLRAESSARWHHQRYLNRLSAALPQQDTYSTAQPAGGLAHLSSLTNTINNLLERNGASHRFTVDELERALRADFHKVVSPDGVVLRVGRGRQAAEVRIKLTLADLFEVLDADVKASEMIAGYFYQASRTSNITNATSIGVSPDFDLRVLAQHLPEGSLYRALAEMVKVGAGAGRNQSATDGAGMFTQGGFVADNRSEALLFDGAAKWTAELRMGEETGWRDTTVVNSGAQGDPATQRLWISHSYTDQRPGSRVRIDDAKRDDRLPKHVLHMMTGLDEAFDKIAGKLGGDFARVGSVSRENLRAFIGDELPHRLQRAADQGIERVFTRNGKPVARVRAETRVVLEESEPLGGPTADEWDERVVVDFVAAPGGASAGGSLQGNVSLGLKHGALEGINGPGDYSPNLGPGASASVSGSRSYSGTANKQGMEVHVHRETRPQQSYRLVLKTTFVVEMLDTRGNRVVDQTFLPLDISSTAVVTMRESDAYRFGLPVDRAALVRRGGQPLVDAEGNQVLRGDPSPDPPPGRRPELPEVIGEGPGKMRGMGPGIVGEVEGLDQITEKVLDQLNQLRGMTEPADGLSRHADIQLARVARLLNEQEIAEQLSVDRVRSAYNTMAQDGVVVDLVRHGLNSATDHIAMRISLKQDFGASQYISSTPSEAGVKLLIGSDTSARSISRSRTWGGGWFFGLGKGPAEGENGKSHWFNRVKNFLRNIMVGSSSGGTVNVVTLQESGPQSKFKMPHMLQVQILHNGKPLQTVTAPGSAMLNFATDLLPSETATPPAPLGQVSDKLLSQMRLLHLDVPGVLKAARKAVPLAMRPGSPTWQKLRAVLTVTSLTSHPKLLTRPLETGVTSRAYGRPVRSSLSVSGRIRDASVLSVVDQVSGDILFGIGSAGVSWGGTTGNSTGNSSRFGLVGDDGTLSNTGTLSGPNRSAGTSQTTSILDIWGSEELTIEAGRQYIVRATVDLTLTGSETMANPLPKGDPIPVGKGEPATEEGAALFSVPEHEVLLMYSQGELDLPGPLVGDAIERLLNGSLPLDRTVAVPLVQRYVMDVAQARKAGEDTSYAKRHTRKALSDKLNELIEPGKPDPAESPAASRAERAKRSLEETLSKANELIKKARNVVLAPAFDNATSVSTTKSFTVTDDQGRQITPLDAVQDVVQAAFPEAMYAGSNLRQELAVDFSQDAARIHLLDMWSPRGLWKSYHVHTGPQIKQAEEVAVNVRLVYGKPSHSRLAELLARTKDILISQLYRYSEQSHTESANGSVGMGLEAGRTDDGVGGGVGLSTDRGQSYSGSIFQQGTRLLRQGRFEGADLVEQTPTMVVEVWRRPVHAGRFRRGLGMFRHGPVLAARNEYEATIVRRIPAGMTRPADQDPGPIIPVLDLRSAELRPGFFPEALWEDVSRPDLFEVVSAQLAKMLGARTVEERRFELLKRFSPSALLTALERMTAPEGHVERLSSLRFRNQGARVRIRARLSDLTIVAGPFDGEKGEVDRKADGQNVTMSRSRALPLTGSVSGSHADSGLGGGVRVGEQVSESVTDHHAARRERSAYVKGKLYSVQFRMDTDLTFEFVARRRNRDERPVGEPVHLPNATQGLVIVTLTEEELAELHSRMERGVRLAPPADPDPDTFPFMPADGRNELIQVLQDARLAARERGMPARVAVWEGNVVHRYVAAPDGSLRSERPEDRLFAQQFASLSPAVLDAAARARLDLRQVFLNSEVSGTFSEQVEAALAERGVAVPEPAKPVWPVVQEESQPQGQAVGSTVPGFAAGSAPSPAIEGTIFDRDARPEGVPDLTLAEVRAQELFEGDLGGARLSWVSDDLLTIQVPGLPEQHVRILIEDPGPELNGSAEEHEGSLEDPHVARLWRRVHPDAVSSHLVHELSHVAQFAAAAAAGSPQGVIRQSSYAQEGDDANLVPRSDEHAHLSRKWHAATDPGVRSNVAAAIDAVAADLQNRGLVPPPPPWGSGSRTAEPEPQSRIARLLNGGPAALTTDSRPTLPEAAATAAIERAAARMGVRVHPRGPGVLDLLVPGHPPTRVEVRPAGVPEQGRAPERGVLTYQVDERLTIGANERAAAATAARAIAEVLGRPAADQAALAELHEAVRQVMSATAAQRLGRLGVLFDLVKTARPEVLALLPPEVAAELNTLASRPRPRDWVAYLHWSHKLANTTGWYPQCTCPDDEPCRCGRREGTPPAPAPAPATADAVQV